MFFKNGEFMKDLDIILTRESQREYENTKIKQEDINLLMQCAMSGPSCLNLRDYAFIIVDDKKKLNEISDLIGPSAKPLKNASLAIVVLMDESRAYEKAKDYRIIDSTIAAQNIMLAANALNIGSVMLGIYPQMDRVNKLNEYFNLPNYISTNSIISLGYKKNKTNGKNHYEEDRIHYNKW